MEPKLRFKEFSGDWEENSISNLCEIIDGDRGKNYPKEKDFLEEGHCLFLNAKNVTKEGFKFDEKMFISEEKDNLMKKGKLQINDLVITSRGTIGNVAYFSEFIPYKDIRINSGMLIIRPHKILPIYLYEAMKSLSFEKQIKLITSGNAQPQLTLANFNKLKINYSSLSEQTKIADFLSTVDEKIQNQQDKITHLENIKKGFMQKIFSRKIRFKDNNGNEFPEWEEKKIEDLFKVSAGGDIDSSLYTKIKTEENIYPVYANALEQNGLYGYSKLYKIKGECITVTARGNIGFAVPRNEKFYPIVRLLVLKPKKNLNIKFFSEIINSTNILIESTGVPQLTAPQMQNVKIKKPCLEEQQKIANFLSSFDEKIDVEKETLEHLKELKKGLLQQMFV